MTRLFVFTSILVASAAVVGSGRALPGDCVEVSPDEAESIRGGACGSYQQLTNAACTQQVGNTCNLGSSHCSGQCDYACPSSSTYGGSGSFTGALIALECDSTTQATCTLTVCSVEGSIVTCCQCLNGNSVACGPSPNNLDGAGCSN
jgi:hypothetical protein